jgi:hypothetical protein
MQVLLPGRGARATSERGGVAAHLAPAGGVMAAEQVVRREVADRDRLAGGAVAGLFGGLVFSSLMLAAHSGAERWYGLKLPAYPFLGQRALRLGPDLLATVVGVLSHLLMACTWGVLFAAVVPRVSRLATVALGALWGLVVWLVMFLVVLPALARPLAEGGGSTGTMVTHLLFGLAVGVGFLPFQRAELGGGPWWHGRPAGERPG